MVRAKKKAAVMKRYPLNMRTTKALRDKLERAAKKSGRSLAQEVERRLERTFDFEQHLVIAHGDHWAPVLLYEHKALLIPLGEKVGEVPWPLYEDSVISLKISPEDLRRFNNFFSGAPWPYTHSNEEVEDAGEQWLQTQRDLRRGK